MPAQVELLVLLLVIVGGVAYVVVRVRRGALDAERAGPQDTRDPGAAVDPDRDGDAASPGEEGGAGE